MVNGNRNGSRVRVEAVGVEVGGLGQGSRNPITVQAGHVKAADVVDSAAADSVRAVFENVIGQGHGGGRLDGNGGGLAAIYEKAGKTGRWGGTLIPISKVRAFVSVSCQMASPFGRAAFCPVSGGPVNLQSERDSRAFFRMWTKYGILSSFFICRVVYNREN